MSKDTKKNIKGTDNRKNTNSKIPKNLKTQDRQNAMKRISKTRQAKMREEEVKSTLKFGVKRCLDSGRKQSNKGQFVRFIRFIKNRRTGERRTGRDSRS